jgi:hypothetical protein
MKCIAAVALGVLLAALPAVAATADQAKPTDPAKPADQAKPAASSAKSGNVSGTVSAVSNTSLTVKASSGEQTFTIDDKTKVVGAKMGRKADAMKKAGEKTVITEFVEMGDTVRVRFMDDSGTKKASEVHVTRKAKV